MHGKIIKNNGENDTSVTLKKLPRTYIEPSYKERVKQRTYFTKDDKVNKEITINNGINNEDKKTDQPIKQNSQQTVIQSKVIKMGEVVKQEPTKQSSDQSKNINHEREAQRKRLKNQQISHLASNNRDNKQIIPGFKGPILEHKNELGYIYVKANPKKYYAEGVIKPMSELFPEKKKRNT